MQEYHRRARRTFESGAIALLLFLVLAPGARALGFDHALTPTDSGIWARSVTLDLEAGVVAIEVAGALWYGGESEPGRTYWRAIDATALSAATAQAMKWSLGRKRPSQSADSGLWFQGARYQSFPSGEVTLQASFVTPFIERFAARNPALWALELLPAFDAAARVKQGAHWQSDVLAGWLLGTGFGLWAGRRESPLFLQALPHGVAVGIRARW